MRSVDFCTHALSCSLAACAGGSRCSRAFWFHRRGKRHAQCGGAVWNTRRKPLPIGARGASRTKTTKHAALAQSRSTFTDQHTRESLPPPPVDSQPHVARTNTVWQATHVCRFCSVCCDVCKKHKQQHKTEALGLAAPPLAAGRSLHAQRKWAFRWRKRWGAKFGKVRPRDDMTREQMVDKAGRSKHAQVGPWAAVPADCPGSSDFGSRTSLC